MKSFIIGFLTCLALIILISSTYIREGQNQNNQIKFNVTNNSGKMYIREGQMSTGKILYNIDGKYIREGQTSTGRIVYNITNN